MSLFSPFIPETIISSPTDPSPSISLGEVPPHEYYFFLFPAEFFIRSTDLSPLFDAEPLLSILVILCVAPVSTPGLDK